MTSFVRSVGPTRRVSATTLMRSRLQVPASGHQETSCLTRPAAHPRCTFTVLTRTRRLHRAVRARTRSTSAQLPDKLNQTERVAVGVPADVRDAQSRSVAQVCRDLFDRTE